MSEHDQADQARKGLIDSLKGKAKEVAGAVTGNDSLTAEGQLEQTQAHERKEANSVGAVADAEAAQAHSEATDAQVEGAKERSAVSAEAEDVKDSVRAAQAAQKQVAERAGQQEVAREKAQAEFGAQRGVKQAQAKERENSHNAVDDLTDAFDEHRTAEQVASNAHDEADRARARAANLTEGADLS